MGFGTQYTERVRVQTVNDEASMTHQSFKAECDVNHIVDRYTQTGMLPLNAREGEYVDASNAEDYQTHLNNIMALQTAYEALPDQIREEFDSPEDWINASLDQERLSEILGRLSTEESGGSSDSSEVTPGASPAAPAGGEETP